jgi:predicted nucleic acid-binding protein
MIPTPHQAVINASPIIFLDKIDHLDLLDQLFSTVWLTSAVLDEVSAGPGGEGLKARLTLVRSIHWLDPSDPASEPLDRDLGKGEASIIAWARLNPDVLLIMDDRAAFARARGYGLSVIGTIGILLLAKERGIIAEIKHPLDDLAKAGCWISEQVREFALKQANEW